MTANTTIPQFASRSTGIRPTPADPAWVDYLSPILSVPGVKRIVTLADFNPKPSSLNADSWVVELEGRVVPELADNEINCGMGIVDTGLNVEDFSPAAGEALLKEIWTASQSDEYAITRDDVDRACLWGLGSERVGTQRIDDEDRKAFELLGEVPASRPARELDLDMLIPRIVRHSTEARRPTALQIRGDHFVELQVIDDVTDEQTLRGFGLEHGRIVLMVHSGYRLTKFVNYHFVLRNMYRFKPWHKRMALFLSKLQFHYGAATAWGRALERWKLYFQQHRYTSIPLESAEGIRYLDACAMASNYAYVARYLLYRLCIEAIAKTWGDELNRKIVRDSTHKSLRVTRNNETRAPESVTVRLGAVECFDGAPAIVAGSYDVPSLLGRARGGPATGNSFDHGSAHFRKRFVGAGRHPSPESETVSRYLIPIGATSWSERTRVVLPIHSRDRMRSMASQLEESGSLSAVAWLRPVANLSEE